MSAELLLAAAASTDQPGPLLWYLNRGTGVVLLVLLTVSTCLGLFASRADTGGRVPAFVRQVLHRDLSLLAVALLTAHVITAVVDSYVDIRWWQAFSPVGASYEPLWLGLGAVALDLIAVVVVSSLLRSRLSWRSWRALHWLAYLAWPISLAHGVGIGTDATVAWARWLGYACLAAVAVSVLLRWSSRARTTPERVPEEVR